MLHTYNSIKLPLDVEVAKKFLMAAFFKLVQCQPRLNRKITCDLQRMFQNPGPHYIWQVKAFSVLFVKWISCLYNPSLKITIFSFLQKWWLMFLKKTMLYVDYNIFSGLQRVGTSPYCGWSCWPYILRSCLLCRKR